MAVPSDFGRFAGLGLQLFLTVALFGALGWWLDGILGWRPWLMVAGLALGAVGGFTMLVRAVPAPRRSKEAE